VVCQAESAAGPASVASPGAGLTRNVILMIGDGMQLEHEVAYSRYATGEDFCLVWDRFPYQGPASSWDVTTYNHYAALRGKGRYGPQDVDPRVGYDPDLGGKERFPIDTSGRSDYFFPADRGRAGFATDSAAAATAIATGVKTDRGNIAWQPGDPDGGALKTIAEELRDQKHFAIGIVSTVPFNHATPAAFVAHNVDRGNYHQLADEIITVSKPEVVIGAGFRHPTYMNMLNGALLNAAADYVVVTRKTGVDGGEALRAGAQRAISAGKKLFGLFGGTDGHFESPVPTHNPGHPAVQPATIENPDLAEAATAALEVLARNPHGFFLMAEQGDIDWANHDRDFRRMIGCVHDLHEAVKSVIAFVNRPGDHVDWGNTLLIVTSDHGSGYMRILDPLGKGELANDADIARTARDVTTATRIAYRSGDHTNELVSVYATGAGSRIFAQYSGAMYPATRIVDNTDIYRVMRTFALEGWSPDAARSSSPFKSRPFKPDERCVLLPR
jgi:alkaline phosphatase